MLRWVVAAGVLLALPTVASAQDAEAGKKVFTKCAPCHAIGPGAKNKVGPELNGLVGRKAGSVEGFNYSRGNEGLGHHLGRRHAPRVHRRPEEEGPGNKMLFPGVKDEVERDDLIAYIKSFNADGSSK